MYEVVIQNDTVYVRSVMSDGVMRAADAAAKIYPDGTRLIVDAQHWDTPIHATLNGGVWQIDGKE
jgi:hypothetical protein